MHQCKEAEERDATWCNEQQPRADLSPPQKQLGVPGALWAHCIDFATVVWAQRPAWQLFWLRNAAARILGAPPHEATTAGLYALQAPRIEVLASLARLRTRSVARRMAVHEAANLARFGTHTHA